MRYDDAASRDHHPSILTVTDIVLREPLPPSWSKEKFSLHTGGGQLIISVPLPLTSYPPSLVPGDGEISFWRLVILWEQGTPLPPRATTIEYVESRIGLVKDNPTVKIVAVLNGNRYRIRNALVETMYKPLGQGHVLLAGNSAHAFSPAGGQGAHSSSTISSSRSNRIELRSIYEIRPESWPL